MAPLMNKTDLEVSEGLETILKQQSPNNLPPNVEI